MDEIHYFSTAPIENEELALLQGQQSQTLSPNKLPDGKHEKRTSLHDETQARTTKIVSPTVLEYSDATAIIDTLGTDRTTYMREYMRKRRAKMQFRETENKKKQHKRKENLENSRECQRQAFTTYKQANPGKVKESDKKTKTKRRECNAEKVKECQKRGFLKYKGTNPEKVREG